MLAATLALGCSSDGGGADGSGGAAGSGGSAGTAGSAGGGGTANVDPGEIRETQITVGDFVFDARVAGPEDGDLVMLLHGFPQTSYEWRHLLKALGEAGYLAVAPDQRGYSPGARPEAIDDYNILLLAQDLIGMVDALGRDRFHLVGHDWGAAVAWLAAVAAADRIESVTPISVPHLDPFAETRADPMSCQFSASDYINNFVMPGFEQTLLANDAALLRTIYSDIPAADVEVYIEELGDEATLRAGLNWYRANFTSDMPAPAIGPVTLPTMYVWSDGDVALCRDPAERTADYVTGPYRFEVLEGISHWIPDEAPDTLNALVLDHLATYPIEG